MTDAEVARRTRAAPLEPRANGACEARADTTDSRYSIQQLAGSASNQAPAGPSTDCQETVLSMRLPFSDIFEPARKLLPGTDNKNEANTRIQKKWQPKETRHSRAWVQKYRAAGAQVPNKWEPG